MYSYKKLLFYFDQYFTVKIGEKLYVYREDKELFAFIRSFVGLLKAWFSLRSERVKPDTSDPRPYQHLVYLDTINQRNAVRSFLERMDSRDLLLVLYEGLNRTALDIPPLQHVHLNRTKLYRLALKYLVRSYFLSRVLRKKYVSTINTSHIYTNLALFLACCDIFEDYLARFKPVSVTVVNDHNLFPLALIYTAKKHGVTSVYIQHASISEVFPKLLVDIALLEGEHSVNTYARIGSYTRQMKLVGIPRMDGFIGFKKTIPSTGLTVGICLKAYYSVELIRDLIEKVRRSPSVKAVVLRPHPGAAQAFWDFAASFQLPVSDSRKEAPLQFLSSIDLLVSGESTILLEASLMRIPTLYFDDKVFPFDLYGYVRHGVVTTSIEDFETIAQVIDSVMRADVTRTFANCRYYCSTVNTEDENRSADILLKFYNTIV
jgi:hypothetical protein